MLHECELPISFLISQDENDEGDLVDSTAKVLFSYTPSEPPGAYYPGEEEAVTINSIQCHGVDLLPMMGEETFAEVIGEQLVKDELKSQWTVSVDSVSVTPLNLPNDEMEEIPHTFWISIDCVDTAFDCTLTADCLVLRNDREEVVATFYGEQDLTGLLAEQARLQNVSLPTQGTKHAPN